MPRIDPTSELRRLVAALCTGCSILLSNVTFAQQPYGLPSLTPSLLTTSYGQVVQESIAAPDEAISPADLVVGFPYGSLPPEYTAQFPEEPAAPEAYLAQQPEYYDPSPATQGIFLIPEPEYYAPPADSLFLAQQAPSYDAPPTPPSAPTAPGKSGDTTYGKRPTPPVVRQQFLRTQSPLLKAGDWQFDVGIAYTLFEYSFPTIDTTGNLVRADLRRRTLIAPLALRYGWNDRTQLYINVPVGWRNSELATSPITTPSPVDIGSNYGGVGDIQLGATYLLYRGGSGCPDVVTTLNFGLPTGEKSLLSNAFQGGLGTGFGSFGTQILFIHTYDPVVIFWGGGYSHYFSGEIENSTIQLGDQFIYQLGAGFAVNDKVTLSSVFYGAYVNPTGVNGNWVPNTQQEPLRYRAALTTQWNCKIVEPFVEIGMTTTSPAARTGLTWTY